MEHRLFEAQLSDAGCSAEEIAYILRCDEQGNYAEALHRMKTVRCRTLEKMHEFGRELDRMDLLIRELQK